MSTKVTVLCFYSLWNYAGVFLTGSWGVILGLWILISRVLNRLFYSLITSSDKPARGRCTTILILNLLDIPKFSLIIPAILCGTEFSPSLEDLLSSELLLLIFSSRNRRISSPRLAIASIRLSMPVLFAI